MKKEINQLTFEIKTPIRQMRGISGDIEEVIYGASICAISAREIPECRITCINGTWYRKCQPQEAEYYDSEFRMNPNEMTM